MSSVIFTFEFASPIGSRPAHYWVSTDFAEGLPDGNYANSNGYLDAQYLSFRLLQKSGQTKNWIPSNTNISKVEIRLFGYSSNPNSVNTIILAGSDGYNVHDGSLTLISEDLFTNTPSWTNWIDISGLYPNTSGLQASDVNNGNGGFLISSPNSIPETLYVDSAQIRLTSSNIIFLNSESITDSYAISNFTFPLNLKSKSITTTFSKNTVSILKSLSSETLTNTLSNSSYVHAFYGSGYTQSYSSGLFKNYSFLKSKSITASYAVSSGKFINTICAFNTNVEEFSAPEFLLSPKVRLTNRKKFASYQLPLGPLVKSQSGSQSFSYANISITKGLSAKEISQSYITPEIAIARALSANPYSQSESPANFYFADSPVALKGSAISQSFAYGSLPINNPVTVQQLTGASLEQSFSHSLFIPYLYLKSKVTTQSFAPEAGKARTVTLESKVICNSHASENLSSPYAKLVALTSEVVCSSVDNKSNISITKPLSSFADSQSTSKVNETILRPLSSLSDEYSSSYSNKSILQKLSSQELSYSYASTHEQIKIGLTSKIISTSISESTDYVITRPLSSRTDCITYSEGLKSLSQEFSSQLTSQSICEYANYKIERNLSANSDSQTYLIPNWHIDKKLNSQTYTQTSLNTHYSILIGLTSKAISQSISEYADLIVTRLLNSAVLTTSEAVTNAISISKKISSKAISQTKESTSSISVLRPFTSEVYSASEASAETTFNRYLESEASTQTRALGTTHCLVNITSRVIAQSINEYADFTATKQFTSDTLESSYSESAISVARQQSSLVYSQSESFVDAAISRRYNSSIISSSYNSSPIQTTRLLSGLSIDQTNSAASIYLTKIFKAYAISTIESFAEASLYISRKFASESIDISEGYSNSFDNLIDLTSEVISQSINEYADYRLQQALISKSIEASASRATETYLGTDNIVTDSLRKVNMNMQVSTDYNYRDND